MEDDFELYTEKEFLKAVEKLSYLYFENAKNKVVTIMFLVDDNYPLMSANTDQVQ